MLVTARYAETETNKSRRIDCDILIKKFNEGD